MNALKLGSDCQMKVILPLKIVPAFILLQKHPPPQNKNFGKLILIITANLIVHGKCHVTDLHVHDPLHHQATL